MKASIVVAFATAVAAGLAGCGRNEAEATPSKQSETASTVEETYRVLSLQDLDELLKSQRGKTVVLNFWATWCPPCVKELPEFAAFYRDHQDSDAVVLLSVSADHPDTLDSTLKPFVAERKLPFPIYLMDFMPSDELTEVLGYEWVGGNLPATFVFKPDGSLQNVWFVTLTKEDLDKAVAKAKGAQES